MLKNLFASFLLFVLILLCPFAGASEEKTLYPIVQKGKWGYIDDTGAIVIKPQFEKADVFHEGLAPIQLGKMVGYIDQTGKIVINPQFDDGWAFSNGLAAVKIGGSLGYIDRSGKYVWNPAH